MIKNLKLLIDNLNLILKKLMNYSKKTTFGNTPIGHNREEYCISLGAFKNDEYRISGSATFISNDLIVTAKHVVEDYWKIYKKKELKFAPPEKGTLELDANFNIHAIQIFDKGKQGALWDVRKIYLAKNTDIAFLRVIPYSDSARLFKHKLPILEFHPPIIGSKLFAFGHTQSKADLYDKKIDWITQPTFSTGIVTNIFHEKRDSSMINFPSIETNARFDGGMSGGPVFNKNGNLIGVVSSNLPPLNTDDEHISYVALIWASMNTIINEKKQPILHLCQTNEIKVEDLWRVDLVYTKFKNNYGIQMKILK